MLVNFDDLFAKHGIKPRGILHLGASDDAKEAPFFARHCQGPVLYVEALPKICARLAAKVALYPGHRALCACLSDEDGKTVEFHVASNAGMSSSMLPFKLHAREHPDVKYIGSTNLVTIRADTLLAKHGIKPDSGWFADIDVQGCEGLVIKGMGEMIHGFDVLHVEYNEREMYAGCTLEPELDAIMAERGFYVIDRIPTKHGWGDKVFRKGDLI